MISSKGERFYGQTCITVDTCGGIQRYSNRRSESRPVGEGRSVALFNVDGRIYATDNQCPHMGYPLTRGAVRHGILTCDWHGRSFDLEGGGCFNYECDDLQTFPVDVRQDEIWIQPGDGSTSGETNISACCGKAC